MSLRLNGMSKCFHNYLLPKQPHRPEDNLRHDHLLVPEHHEPPQPSAVTWCQRVIAVSSGLHWFFVTWAAAPFSYRGFVMSREHASVSFCLHTTVTFHVPCCVCQSASAGGIFLLDHSHKNIVTKKNRPERTQPCGKCNISEPDGYRYEFKVTVHLKMLFKACMSFVFFAEHNIGGISNNEGTYQNVGILVIQYYYDESVF